MPNPSTRWDRVPVFGVWLKVDDTPSPGKVAFGVGQRVTRVDGREIYPEGAQLEVTIGKQDEQDATVRSTVRAAWRAADAAAAGANFDAVAWDTRWDTVIVPAAIFARFPAADDPDIVQSGYTVTVSERLASGKGKSYSIQPLLSQLDLPVPGINLGLVEVPPDATSTPAPVYAKGVPGGVAALDVNGNVINADGVVLLPAGEPAAGSVTNTTISPTAAIELTKTVDAGDRLAMTAAERAKIAAAALANQVVPVGRTVTAGDGLQGGGDLGADRTLSVRFGTTSDTAVRGNDSRLSDARAPLAHDASLITSGLVAPARLGTGTASSSTVLYGDGVFRPHSGGSGGSSVDSVAGRTGAVVLSSEDITDWAEAVQDVVGGASPCTDDFVAFNGGTPPHPDTPATHSLSGSVFTVTRPVYANPSSAWDYNIMSIPLGTVEELQGRRYFIRADDRDSEAKIDYAGSGFTATPTAGRDEWPQIGSLIAPTTGQWLVFDNLYELAVGQGYPPTDTFYLSVGQQSYDTTTPAINWKIGAAYTTEGAGDNVILADGLRGVDLAEFTTASEVEAMISGNEQYITCWGDSLTAGGGWTTSLQTMSGLTVYNAGTSGENAPAIMARQGGDVMMVNNITIPATTTPVLVNTRTGDGGILTAFGHRVMPLLEGGTEHVNPVRIGDIEGTLIWTGADWSDTTGTWTFTRSVAGSEVVIDRPTAMTTGYDRNRNNGIMIVFMGQNGGWADDDELVTMHKLMRAHHRGGHMVVLGLSSGSSASNATYEAAMRKEFGRYFISLREYLSTYGLADAGLTPTGADTTAMAVGEVPPQLLSDTVHYTTACKTVIGNMLYKKMRELGII